METQSTVEIATPAALFAVPTLYADDTTQQKLVALAAAEFAEIEIPAPVPVVPVGTLRATLRQLAPAVRMVASGVDFLGCDVYDRSGESHTVERAEVPALLAHFALVALALVEAEAEVAQ